MSITSSPPDQESLPPDGKAAPSGRHRRALASALGGLRAAGALLTAPSGPAEPLLGNASRRWVRLVPYVIALGFVATLIPVTTEVLSNDYGIPGALAGALGVAQAAPLLLAVSRPLLAWGIVIVADIVGAIVVLTSATPRAAPWTPMVIVGYLVLCFVLSVRESRRTVLGIWLVTVASGLVLDMFRPAGSPDTAVLLIVLSGGVLLLGTLLRERGEAQRRLVEQETISEAERSRRTLLEERARIARELHDVVAHHMSVITVQADSAPYRLQGLTPEACEEFGSIAAGARESLGEMRRLLAVLRSEDTPDGERAPQPGLGRLQQLVEATVRGGVPAELSMPELTLVGELTDVPPTVDLSAYRIVQEALANVVRHAPGARTQISVSKDEESLLVIVVNGPAGEHASPVETTGTGHGLIGMHERVRLVGGTLDVGPLPGGGFRVAARLPLADPDSPSS
ncbi:sensor histidine kinase [Streptomyces antnestii]|uniref:histidine kinase n=1 Tax=Streptomyces antnestii TaxID=2494256 RepID=A0A437PV08_9ACTN|nr:sensor histidine kinase [Streptomyces sp. San01]RVU26086.1 sensor histidine kinase [Streptomyces sp. San01]